MFKLDWNAQSSEELGQKGEVFLLHMVTVFAGPDSAERLRGRGKGLHNFVIQQILNAALAAVSEAVKCPRIVQSIPELWRYHSFRLMPTCSWTLLQVMILVTLFREKKRVNSLSSSCLSLLKVQADLASSAAQTHISRLSPREGKANTLGTPTSQPVGQIPLWGTGDGIRKGDTKQHKIHTHS